MSFELALLFSSYCVIIYIRIDIYFGGLLLFLIYVVCLVI